MSDGVCYHSSFGRMHFPPKIPSEGLPHLAQRLRKNIWMIEHLFLGDFANSKHCWACRNGYLKVNPNSDESLRLLVANLHKMQPLVLEARGC